jgi:hypothetical protein
MKKGEMRGSNTICVVPQSIRYHTRAVEPGMLATIAYRNQPSAIPI